MTLCVPSNAAFAANAQHAPQIPWLLIGVTAPNVLQSIEAGILPARVAIVVVRVAVVPGEAVEFVFEFPVVEFIVKISANNIFWNSSSVWKIIIYKKNMM